jgi:hypothetical protein
MATMLTSIRCPNHAKTQSVSNRLSASLRKKNNSHTEATDAPNPTQLNRAGDGELGLANTGSLSHQKTYGVNIPQMALQGTES